MSSPKREVYMYNVVKESRCVFVKALTFSNDQGGFVEGWGLVWKPIVATWIEDSREKACNIEPNAKPYSEQAKLCVST